MLDALRRPLLGAALVLVAGGLVATSTTGDAEPRLSLGTSSGPVTTSTPRTSTTAPVAPTSSTSLPTRSTSPKAPAPKASTATTARTPTPDLPPAASVDPNAPEPGVVKGRVTDEAGRPVAGMCLQSTFPGPDGGQHILARTGTDGRYRTGELAIAMFIECDLERTPFGHTSMESFNGLGLDYSVGVVRDFTVQTLGAIRGLVVDEAGNPVSGVIVGFSGIGAGGIDGRTTGPDGRFDVRHVTPGTSTTKIGQDPYRGGKPQDIPPFTIEAGRWTDAVIVVHPWAPWPEYPV